MRVVTQVQTFRFFSLQMLSQSLSSLPSFVTYIFYANLLSSSSNKKYNLLMQQSYRTKFQQNFSTRSAQQERPTRRRARGKVQRNSYGKCGFKLKWIIKFIFYHKLFSALRRGERYRSRFLSVAPVVRWWMAFILPVSYHHAFRIDFPFVYKCSFSPNRTWLQNLIKAKAQVFSLKL